MTAQDCICFPADEPPMLELKAEIEAAKAVRCPIHGERFSEPAIGIYRPPHFIRPTLLQPESCSVIRFRRSRCRITLIRAGY
jgi:hypothetical protein